MGDTFFECLQRQVTEMEALNCVFPEEGGFLLSEVERENLAAATQAVVSGCKHASVVLSGAVRLPEVSIRGQPVHLRFALPPTYPLVRPTLQVDCNSSRDVHELLTDQIARCAQEKAGEEVLLLTVDCLRHAIKNLAHQHTGPSDVADSGTPGDAHVESHSEMHAAEAEAATAMTISRRLIWFHHILNTTKRKSIINWGNDLELGGYCVPGHPGVLICEGEEANVVEYLRRIRGLRWQAMAVRYEENEKCQPGETLDALRLLKCNYVRELSPERGLSDLGQICKEAGLQHMFITALKLS